MPSAPEAQVPRPLTYALMFHLVWTLLFAISGVGLAGLFLSAGQPVSAAGLPLLFLLPLAAFSFLLLVGLFVARVQLVAGALDRDTVFGWSEASGWVVLAVAPAGWLFAWWWRQATPPLTTELTSRLTQVELVVWWLSHLLGVMMLRGARRRYGAKASAAAHTNSAT